MNRLNLVQLKADIPKPVGLQRLQLKHNTQIARLCRLSEEADAKLVDDLNDIVDALAIKQILRYKYAVYEALREWIENTKAIHRRK